MKPGVTGTAALLRSRALVRAEVDVETSSGSTTKMIPADLDGGHIDEKENSRGPGLAVYCQYRFTG